VLLHGFPQSWYEWRKVIPLLARDFYVIAPDLRGMGDSALETTGQDKRTLASDIKGMLDAFGIRGAAIVGHDWGGGVAQRFALDYPQIATCLICLDIPYIPALGAFPERSWSFTQLCHSWYLFFHLDPWLPEQIAQLAATPYLRWFYEHGSGDKGSPFTDTDIAEYARWFSQPLRATAGFNLYRAHATTDVEHWLADSTHVVTLPALWIHGMCDPFIPSAHLDLLPKWFTNAKIERIDGCGHWVPEEEPEVVARLIRGFLEDVI
jgi:pimeloyl-ACP methyl ester carboxylesterase